MTQSTLDNQRIVDEVVAALTGAETAAGAPPADIKLQLQRAAKEFDERTAESFCKALIEHLATDPGSVRALEALIILGLSHPKVLTRHRIPLMQEGRRLALLLERAGETGRAESLLEVLATNAPGDKAIDHELASMMRRTGNADRLIDRYLRRAEEAVAQGRSKQAVQWLQEVLMIDRNRRDVARMIRDLRYEQEEKRASLRRRVGAVLTLLLLAGAAAGAVWHEREIGARYAALAPADSTNVQSVRTRLHGVDDLIESNPLWIGKFDASKERSRLRAEIQRFEAAESEQKRAQVDEQARNLELAESARQRGRQYAEQGAYGEALIQLESALASAPADWEPREKVEIDVRALRQWQAEHAAEGLKR